MNLSLAASTVTSSMVPSSHEPSPAIRLHAASTNVQGYCKVGVPLPRGWLHTPEVVLETEHDRRTIPCQVASLSFWNDGSVQWLEVIFFAAAESGVLPAWLLRPRGSNDRPSLLTRKVRIEELATQVQIHTGTHDFSWPIQGRWEWTSRGNSVEPLARCHCNLVDARGRMHAAIVQSSRMLKNGPLWASYLISGSWEGTDLLWEAELDCFANSAQIRMEFTVKNPRRARHAGGFWDLGDPGSCFLRGLSIDVQLQKAEEVPTVHWRLNQTDAVHTTQSTAWSIQQESSGGEQWQSLNHVNYRGRVPWRYRGYRVLHGNEESSGERAEPIVSLQQATATVTCAVEDFWQKFPTAISVSQSQLSIQLLPAACSELHELQAGEHFTRVVWLDFTNDPNDSITQLTRVYDPLRIQVSPQAVHESEAVWCFPDPQLPDRAELAQVRTAALTGANNYFAKREAIDEYGWRNYGDVWADHEAAYCSDPAPVVSHYNNQYDLLHSLLLEYLRSGDVRWWQLAAPLARHVIDIDIYHTQRDKPAYNGGLFWHTAHYHAVGKASHRCASTTMLGKQVAAFGTGPCNEHNYSTGLWLYHLLTGSRVARDAVIGLAEWVIAMDDGRQHVLGIASSQPTGDASRTNEAEYHGAGRGAGNSINSLLNGWLLTLEERYLVKAQELIERCIHPHDDLTIKQLDNAELRWSYTVFLQAIMRFEFHMRHDDRVANLRHYIEASVRHYARWMVSHERFYLDQPEKLEYPTETWAAQELRKGNVLLMAAQYADPEEHTIWIERGFAMLDRAWQSLLQFDSYDCTRPLAVALQQGYLETYLRSTVTQHNRNAGELMAKMEWPAQPEFMSQKRDLKRCLRSPLGWLRLAKHALRPMSWWRAYRQTWLAERVRRGFQ